MANMFRINGLIPITITDELIENSIAAIKARVPLPTIDKHESIHLSSVDAIICMQREIVHYISTNAKKPIKYIGTKLLHDCILAYIYSDQDHVAIHIDPFGRLDLISIFAKFASLKNIEVIIIGGNNLKYAHITQLNLTSLVRALYEAAQFHNIEINIVAQQLLEKNILTEKDKYNFTFNVLINILDILCRQTSAKPLPESFFAKHSPASFRKSHGKQISLQRINELIEDLVQIEEIYDRKKHRDVLPYALIKERHESLNDYLDEISVIFSKEGYEIFKHKLPEDYLKRSRLQNFVFNVNTKAISVTHAFVNTPFERNRNNAHFDLTSNDHFSQEYHLAYDGSLEGMKWKTHSYSNRFIQDCLKLSDMIDKDHSCDLEKVAASFPHLGETNLSYIVPDMDEILLPHVCRLRKNYDLYQEYQKSVHGLEINGLASVNLTTEFIENIILEIQRLPLPHVINADAIHLPEDKALLVLQEEMLHYIPDIEEGRKRTKYTDLGTKNLQDCIFAYIYSGKDHLLMHIDPVEKINLKDMLSSFVSLDNIEVMIIGGNAHNRVDITKLNLTALIKALYEAAEYHKIKIRIVSQQILKNNTLTEADKCNYLFNEMITCLDTICRHLTNKGLPEEFFEKNSPGNFRKSNPMLREKMQDKDFSAGIHSIVDEILRANEVYSRVDAINGLPHQLIKSSYPGLDDFLIDMTNLISLEGYAVLEKYFSDDYFKCSRLQNFVVNINTKSITNIHCLVKTPFENNRNSAHFDRVNLPHFLHLVYSDRRMGMKWSLPAYTEKIYF